MSLERIENTSIWKNTLANMPDDNHALKREELRTAIIKFRENTDFLVSKISADFPELTQHDIGHLDALWEIASVIIGENYPLTPLEGFILGGAILLHDSALCFEAYENGKDGLRKTVQWKDSYAAIHETDGENTDANVECQADFYAIRLLHAQQAENLLTRSWVNSEDGNQIYLLENQNLRKHYGKLIGQIAASHHWDIETVVSLLPSQQNALAGYPREWRIDPVKIACILRCADAAHIDSERAPDFLHALLKRNGISLDHWTAQNRLAAADIDQSDNEKSTLLYTSTIDFSEEDSDSWFVAYDAACLIDKELKSCNSTLESYTNGKSFQVKKVKGVESPESMSKYIKPINWKPCSAKVHVGNIEKVIHNLGGEMLYGSGSDLVEIVLRELIQNARDSILARSVFETDFEGKIKIKIEDFDGSFWLIITDNGIGMSERVLTGPLLDFGTSFWTSNLVQSEFPGLRSSKFKSIGKFGIGFYSVFMIANQVSISSRKWTDGLYSINQLKFPRGFSLRPIMSKGAIAGFSSSASTQIKLKLKKDTIPQNLNVEIKTNWMGSSNFKVPFSIYLSALCAGLDVPVYYKENENKEIKIHENIEIVGFDKSQWLKNISFAEFQTDNSTIEYISNNLARLKPIYEEEKILGLAAISTKISNTQDFLSIDTIGGLSNTVHNRDGQRYIGFIDFNPKSAKREIGTFRASEGAIKNWAEDQLRELLNLELNPVEKYCASSALCHFKVDPIELAQILVSYNNLHSYMTIDQIADLSTKMGLVFLDSGYGDGGHIETHHKIQAVTGHALIVPLSNSPFLSLKRINDIPENNFSILDCVYRGILRKGYSPNLNIVKDFAPNIFSKKMNAIILSSKIN